MSEALDLSEIPAGLPGRIHEVADRHVAASPHRTALIENGASWTYKELDRAVVDVAAFVQLMPGSSVKPADLMAFINPQLTSYKRPSEIVVLDALPATSTGKIVKHKLAESLRGA